MMQPLQQAQAKKDADAAALKEQLDAQAKVLAEFTGDQPAVGYRPSAAADNTLRTEAELLAAVKSGQSGAGPFDDIIRGLGIPLPGRTA
jgi:hypothetical protein